MRRGRWSPRRLVRPLSEPLQRIGSWVSARYPFVWFTRTPLWAGCGLLATLAAALWGRALSVRPVGLPTIESMVVMLSSWTFVVYALLLVLAVDIVRRGPVFLPGNHSLRLAGCVFVSTACLLLPQYAFLRIALPRIAAVDTQRQVEATLARLEQVRNGTWFCGEREELERLLDTHRVEIERDLLRWGFPTNVTVVRGCPSLDTSSLFSLQMPSRSAKDPSTSSPLESFIGVNRAVGLDTFQERLLTVDAAQHYARGEASAFETTRTPTMAHDLLGEYAVGPPITSRLFQIPLVGLLVAAAIGFVAATRFYRMRAMKASRLWLSAIRVQPAAMYRVSEWVAARLPTVWASRTYNSLLPLIVLVLLGTLLGGQLVTGTLIWAAAPALVVVGFVTLRAQENARHLTLRPWQSFGIFALHWASIGLFSAAIAQTLGVMQGASLGNVITVVWLIALVSAMLQTARFSSALLTYFAAILATAVAVGGLFLADWLRSAMWTSLSTDIEFLVILAVMEGLVGLGVHSVARFDMRPVIRRLVVGVFVLLAPFAGILLTIALLTPSPSDVTAPKMAASVLLLTVVVAIALRLTANHRRILAHSGR